MRFSIITAVRNNKDTLRKAIASLHIQTCKDYEHIIIDGASTDGTIDIIKELADEKTKWTSESDAGIYDALNKGIKMASGDIICLLHSDDMFAEPEVLSAVAKVFDENDIDSVYGDLLYIKKIKDEEFDDGRWKMGDGNTGTSASVSSVTYNHTFIQTLPGSQSSSVTEHSVLRYWKTQKKDFVTESERRKALKFGWMPPHPAFFVKKNVYEKYGVFDTSLKISADYELVLRLLWNKKITAAYLPKVITHMTNGGMSNRSIGNIIMKSKEDYSAMKRNYLPFPLFTLICKNFRKLPQFVAREKKSNQF